MFGERFAGGGEAGGVVVVAEKFELGRHRDADARAFGEGFVGRDERPGVGIVRVVDGGCVQGFAGGGGVAGKNRHAVEAAAGRNDAAGAEQSAGGFHAEQAVKGGGHPARTSGVGPERDVGLAAGHRDRRARTRSARNVSRVDWVPGDAVGRAHANQAGGKLIHVGFSGRQHTGGDQGLDNKGALGRREGIIRTAGGGRDAS